MSIDAFEQAMEAWFRGVLADVKAQRERANIRAFCQLAQERGNTVTFDETGYYLKINAPGKPEITVTRSVAQEESPASLVQWVEQAQCIP